VDYYDIDRLYHFPCGRHGIIPHVRWLFFEFFITPEICVVNSVAAFVGNPFYLIFYSDNIQ